MEIFAFHFEVSSSPSPQHRLGALPFLFFSSSLMRSFSRSLFQFLSCSPPHSLAFAPLLSPWNPLFLICFLPISSLLSFLLMKFSFLSLKTFLLPSHDRSISLRFVFRWVSFSHPFPLILPFSLFLGHSRFRLPYRSLSLLPPILLVRC